MEIQYRVGDDIVTVSVERQGDRFRVRVGDRVYDLAVSQSEPGRLDLQFGDRRRRAYVAIEGRTCWVALDGETWRLEQPEPERRAARTSSGRDGTGSLTAEMPGQVLEVLVAEGDRVSRGDPLVLLEAMKMELRLTAPASGRVARLHCAAGQIVERGQPLIEIEEGD